jgi:hypothetical protein
LSAMRGSMVTQFLYHEYTTAAEQEQARNAVPCAASLAATSMIAMCRMKSKRWTYITRHSFPRIEQMAAVQACRISALSPYTAALRILSLRVRYGGNEEHLDICHGQTAYIAARNCFGHSSRWYLTKKSASTSAPTCRASRIARLRQDRSSRLKRPTQFVSTCTKICSVSQMSEEVQAGSE